MTARTADRLDALEAGLAELRERMNGIDAALAAWHQATPTAAAQPASPPRPRHLEVVR